MRVNGLTILGTDTEVGKTFQGVQLARHLAANKVNVGVYKPVASGTEPPGCSDAELLLEASGCNVPLSVVCPQQFSAALAPPVAAELENRKVDETLLVAGAEALQSHCEYLIVEGAGGVLSPVSESMTALDLAVKLGFPVALVAANRLGMINHTLMSLDVISRSGLSLEGVVVGDVPPRADAVLDRTNHELLQKFAPDVRFVRSLVDLIEVR